MGLIVSHIVPQSKREELVVVAVGKKGHFDECKDFTDKKGERRESVQAE